MSEAVVCQLFLSFLLLFEMAVFYDTLKPWPPLNSDGSVVNFMVSTLYYYEELTPKPYHSNSFIPDSVLHKYKKKKKSN